MRPLEILLLVVDLGALLSLLVGQRVAPSWVRHAALLVLPAGVLQLIMEGQRWQLVGLYGLAILLLLAWVLRIDRHRRWVRIVAGGLGGLALVISTVVPVAIPVFVLPRPSGPYGIGTATYHWVDQNREEIFTEEPGDRREIIGQLWYPASPGFAGGTARYLDDPRVLESLAVMLDLPPFTFNHFDAVRTHAVEGAPIATSAAGYPVLIFVHGRGGYRQHNTRQVEELVSRGYVVLAVDLPYAASGVTMPDGRLIPLDPWMLDAEYMDSMIPFLAEDVSFALDRLADLNTTDPDGRLTGRLDLDRVGLFGLSLGAAVAAETCRVDQRFRACLPIDGYAPAPVVSEGLEQPTLWLTRDAETMRQEGWSEGEIIEMQYSMRAEHELHRPGSYLVQVPGMYHLDFSDASLISPLARPLGMSGPIDPARGREIIDTVMINFFDRYVRDLEVPDLTSLSERYPEVVIERSG